MAEILLGHSYFMRLDPKQWKTGQPYPPLGTLYAAAWLRQQGRSVAVFDSMLAASPKEWAEALQQHRPRYAVLYEDSFNYLTKMCLLRMRRAAFEMISAARSFGCTVIVHGPDESDQIRQYLSRGAHYVLQGEGEISLSELISSLQECPGQALDVPGVISVQNFETGGIRRSSLNNPDHVPFPARDLIDLDRYREAWQRRHGFFSTNIVTSRGCPFSCSWCAKPVFGQRYHARSPENVVSEMIWLQEHVKPDHLWFADDIFGLKKGWIHRFSRLLGEVDLKIPFKCLLRADGVDEGVAGALKQAGCRMVWIGAESGSQKVLDAMRKGIAVADTQRAVQLLKGAGIGVGLFIQFGYPGEEWDDIRKTRHLIRESMPDDIGISVSYPLPGTPFHDQVRTQVGGQQNWTDSSDLVLLFKGTFTPRFYRALHRAVHREYRVRKAWRGLSRAGVRRFLSLARSLALPLDRFRLFCLRQWS